jgi:hypothetical protein
MKDRFVAILDTAGNTHTLRISMIARVKQVDQSTGIVFLNDGDRIMVTNVSLAYLSDELTDESKQ